MPVGCRSSLTVLGEYHPSGMRTALGSLQHPLPQEPDVCPSIALALEQLQTVDLALDGTIAPGQREPRFDGREILPQALSKACECLNPAPRAPPQSCMLPVPPSRQRWIPYAM